MEILVKGVITFDIWSEQRNKENTNSSIKIVISELNLEQQGSIYNDNDGGGGLCMYVYMLLRGVVVFQADKHRVTQIHHLLTCCQLSYPFSIE